MKRLLALITVVTAALVLLGAPSAQATTPHNVTITVLNPAPEAGLGLDVGEAYTFDIQVTSDDLFIMTIAQTDSYYPGRGVFWHGGDVATHSTSALLHLTVTGKRSTAELAAVYDWPFPEDCWPEGVAPLAIVVGVRFQGGEVVVDWFPFMVEVP